MSKERTQELRRYSRLNRTFPVDVRPLSFSPAQSQALQAQCYDISEGGLSLESSKPFPQGTILQARIHIPMLNRFSPGFLKVWENDAEQYFTALTEVIWCQPRGGQYLVGMRYTSVDESQARALAALINKAFQAENSRKQGT